MVCGLHLIRTNGAKKRRNVDTFFIQVRKSRKFVKTHSPDQDISFDGNETRPSRGSMARTSLLLHTYHFLKDQSMVWDPMMETTQWLLVIQKVTHMLWDPL
ncbi:hypothetical protein Tco_0736193 [Tanacetum coccineum]